MSTRIVRTVCPRNCYCTCGMLVTVEDGRVVAIDGDPRNPATGGHVCLKGLSYARRAVNTDRLLVPMGRARRDHPLQPMAWEDVIDAIAERMDRIRREDGPAAVLFYEGSGSHGALGQLAFAFWHQFGGCTVPFGDLCWPAGLEATRLTYGANLHNHPRLTRDSRFVLIWGHNPAETNVHQMRLLLDAQQRGARLALVDPRETDTSDFVDLVIRPTPGTDAALALGMARAIVDEGLHDRAFLARHAHGVDEYLRRLADYPIDRVSAITGVPASTIRELALAYAAATPALLIAGFGVQRHRHGGQTLRAISLLPALTGNVGAPGGGWQYANLASHCLQPAPLPARPVGVRSGFPVSRLGNALANLAGPPIRAAWIEKANPVSQNPDTNAVLSGLARLDVVVVVDDRLTDTASVADFVLPATSIFEQEDLVTGYWHPYVQRRARILEPPAQVKPETEIWRLLAARFGLDTSWFPSDVDGLLRSMMPAGSASLFDRLADEPLDLSGIGDVAFADRRFPTPSGKVEFRSDEAARLWHVDPIPDYEPLEGLERYPLHLLSCKTRDRIHSQFGNIDWIRDVERPHHLEINPEDARARGLRDGDRAIVRSPRGEVTMTVRVAHGIRPGVTHVLEGRSHEDDPRVNLLTEDGVTDMGYGATFYDCMVEVCRIENRGFENRDVEN